MTPQELRTHIQRLAQQGAEHLELAHNYLHEVEEDRPDTEAEQEAYFAAIIALAQIILSKAPGDMERIRVQLLAHELCAQHEVDLGEAIYGDLIRDYLKAVEVRHPEAFAKLREHGIDLSAPFDSEDNNEEDNEHE